MFSHKIYNFSFVNSNNIYIPLQQELNRQGFKNKNGNPLVVDRVTGEFTLSACPLVRKGACVNITRWIQEELTVDADGIFGEITEEAVRKWQLREGLVDDGVIGINSWKVLLGKQHFMD